MGIKILQSNYFPSLRNVLSVIRRASILPKILLFRQLFVITEKSGDPGQNVIMLKTLVFEISGHLL